MSKTVIMDPNGTAITVIYTSLEQILFSLTKEKTCDVSDSYLIILITIYFNLAENVSEIEEDPMLRIWKGRRGTILICDTSLRNRRVF